MSYHFSVKQPLAVFFEFELRISRQFWISNYLHEQGNGVWLWDRNQRSYYNHAILDLINPGYLLQSPILEMSLNKCLVPSSVFVSKMLVSIHDNVGKWLITPPSNWRGANKMLQLIMKRIFLCDWFFVGKCIGDYGLDFVLEMYCWLAGCWYLLVFVFSCSFHFPSFHLISIHLISSHFISCRFISFHFISFPFLSIHCIPFHVVSFRFISSHFISFHSMSFHVVSFRFISSHFLSFHSIPFHFISFLPGHLDWSAPWHDILHEWNARIGMYRTNWRQVGPGDAWKNIEN